MNEATYIISSAAETKNYTCKITNSDGAVKEQNFWVEVRRIVTYERQEERVVSKGETVELEMLAKSLAGVELTYQWYKGTDGPGYTKMEGDNSFKLSVGKVTSSSLVYYCEVGDGIVSQMYRFLIRVDTGLVFKNTNTKLKGKVGEKVVFNSEAVAEAGEEQITYQWYATDEEEEDQFNDSQIVLQLIFPALGTKLGNRNTRCIIDDQVGSANDICALNQFGPVLIL